MRLDETVNALERIASALEERNKPKGIESPIWSRTPINCVGNQGTPLPNTNTNTPYCEKDVLYKKPDAPNWYDSYKTYTEDLTKDLY